MSLVQFIRKQTLQWGCSIMIHFTANEHEDWWGLEHDTIILMTGTMVETGRSAGSWLHTYPQPHTTSHNSLRWAHVLRRTVSFKWDFRHRSTLWLWWPKTRHQIRKIRIIRSEPDKMNLVLMSWKLKSVTQTNQSEWDGCGIWVDAHSVLDLTQASLKRSALARLDEDDR